MCPRCHICTDVLKKQGPGATEDEVETLPCYHVLHKHCLDRYSGITGKRRQNCCPFKCILANEKRTEEDMLLLSLAASAATGPSNSQVNMVDDALAVDIMD